MNLHVFNMFLQDFYMFHINLHVFLHVSTYCLQDSTSQSDNLFYFSVCSHGAS